MLVAAADVRGDQLEDRGVRGGLLDAPPAGDLPGDLQLRVGDVLYRDLSGSLADDDPVVFSPKDWQRSAQGAGEAEALGTRCEGTRQPEGLRATRSLPAFQAGRNDGLPSQGVAALALG